MSAGPTEFLTTRELAALLRMKERRIYELAAAGEIPCRRATGKLLFPRDEIEAWLSGDRIRAAPGAEPQRPNVFVGSHDPLLEWALLESRSGLAALLDGSLDGLARLGRGEAVAAGIHLIEPETDDWNRAHIEHSLGDEPVVSLEWAWRQQGLILAQRIAEEVGGLRDLRGRRFIPRQAEAGTYVLFQELLRREAMSETELELASPPARGQSDIALAIAEGKAEAGLGLACMARRFHLPFVPLTRERFELVVYRRAYFEPPFQRLLAFCRTPAFRKRAEELGGYDVSGFGTVRFNGP